MFLQYSSIAQSVEHAAVNRAVVGSSPTRGAFFVLSDEPDEMWVCNTLITSSNLVVASLMRASESFIYKDSGVFVLSGKVCKIYAGKREVNRLRKEHRKKEI